MPSRRVIVEGARRIVAVGVPAGVGGRRRRWRRAAGGRRHRRRAGRARASAVPGAAPRPGAPGGRPSQPRFTCPSQISAMNWSDLSIPFRGPFRPDVAGQMVIHLSVSLRALVETLRYPSLISAADMALAVSRTASSSRSHRAACMSSWTTESRIRSSGYPRAIRIVLVGFSQMPSQLPRLFTNRSRHRWPRIRMMRSPFMRSPVSASRRVTGNGFEFVLSALFRVTPYHTAGLFGRCRL